MMKRTVYSYISEVISFVFSFSAVILAFIFFINYFFSGNSSESFGLKIDSYELMDQSKLYDEITEKQEQLRGLIAKSNSKTYPNHSNANNSGSLFDYPFDFTLLSKIDSLERDIIAQQLLLERIRKKNGYIPLLSVEECLSSGILNECLDKEKIVTSLADYQYAFNEPAIMSINSPAVISLVIEADHQVDSTSILQSQFSPSEHSSIALGIIKATRQMEAELSGHAFKIEREGRLSQQLSKRTPTRWDWEVTPLREGRHQLSLSLYVIITQDGEKISEDRVLAERRTIIVTVTPFGQLYGIVTNPIWASLFTLLGAAAGLLAWFGFKGWPDFFNKPEKNEPTKVEISFVDKETNEPLDRLGVDEKLKGSSGCTHN